MLEQLKNKIINDSSLELTPFQIDYLVKELDKINVWYEVARNEVETAIDDIANDEYYSDEDKKKLDTLTDEDINRIAWKVYDENVWQDVYECAREEVVEELELE